MQRDFEKEPAPPGQRSGGAGFVWIGSTGHVLAEAVENRRRLGPGGAAEGIQLPLAGSVYQTRAVGPGEGVPGIGTDSVPVGELAQVRPEGGGEVPGGGVPIEEGGQLLPGDGIAGLKGSVLIALGDAGGGGSSRSAPG